LKETLQFLTQHGYWLLFGAVLGRQACLPVPANLFLVAGGALAHSGKLNFARIVGLAVMAFVLADFAWFEAGRRWGDRCLHFLCGLSRDSEGCAGKARHAFARNGVRTLLISKFVVGLDAVAVPLAGAGRVPLVKFALFDTLGALLWSICYAAVGYLFSDQLDRVALHAARMGALLALVAAAVCGFYVVKKLVHYARFLREFTLARITAQELKDKLSAGSDILIIDLQGKASAMAIPGAIRLDPWRADQYLALNIPATQEVVVYCASPGEFRSARAALALRQKGVIHVRPLAGGFREWRARGFPVTAHVDVPAGSAQ
jgi:membrane protein DedA with SNARE-associated domain/rhodanese-related sulfurtransferase